MDEILTDDSYYKCVHKGLLDLMKMKSQIGKIEFHEVMHERYDKLPVQFFRFVKKLCPSRTQDTHIIPLHSQPSVTEESDMQKNPSCIGKGQLFSEFVYNGTIFVAVVKFPVKHQTGSKLITETISHYNRCHTAPFSNFIHMCI